MYYIHDVQRTWTSHTEHQSNVPCRRNRDHFDETVFFFPFCNFKFENSIINFLPLLHWHRIFRRLPNMQCVHADHADHAHCENGSVQDKWPLPTRWIARMAYIVHTRLVFNLSECYCYYSKYDRRRSLESTCFLEMIFVNLKTIFLFELALRRCIQHTFGYYYYIKTLTKNPTKMLMKNKIHFLHWCNATLTVLTVFCLSQRYIDIESHPLHMCMCGTMCLCTFIIYMHVENCQLNDKLL